MRYVWMVTLFVALAGCDGFFGPLNLDVQPSDASVDAGQAGDAVNNTETMDASILDAGSVTDVGQPTDAGTDGGELDACIPTTERCGDAIDSDCDGDPNNGFEMLGMACDSEADVDTCNDGVFECQDGVAVCDDDAASVERSEVCAGIYPRDCILEVYPALDMLGEACLRAGPGGQPGDCPNGVFECNAAFTALVCVDPNPMPEICGDNIDNDCDGTIDVGTAEVCDMRDNDCDGAIDNGLPLGNPCTDNNSCRGTLQCDGAGGIACTIVQTSEVCDGFDNDCDGSIDEGCDDDADGYCDENIPYFASAACVPGDCADSLSSVNPDASEGSVCDSIDNNCNGQIDEGVPLQDGAYSGNDTLATATSITGSPFSNVGVPISPLGVTRLISGDIDYFEFSQTIVTAPSNISFVCQLSQLGPADTAQVTVQVFPPNTPSRSSPAASISNLGVIGVSDPNPTTGDYSWIVGIEPLTGFDTCDNDYLLTCKGRVGGSLNTW